MNRYLKVGLVSLLVLILTTAAFGAGIAVGTSDMLRPAPVLASDQPEEFEVFWQVWGLVQRRFVDRDAIDPQTLTYGAVNGLINALGDEGHTRFLTPEQANEQRTNISGKFSGIGARVGVEDGMAVIVAPMDDSPAYKAGVKAGDIILEVDGTDVTTMELGEIIDMIRGEEGTEVVITFFRPDSSESLEIPIVRGEIVVPAASWTMVPGTDTALIRMTQFSANISGDLIESIEEAQEAGATSLVLDVRNNPGGLLDEAIKVVSQFVDEGNALLQEDADGNREAYPIEPGGVATDIPIVVLVNRGSASASEIFAGAVQDNERGIVVGETTFGTGTVLQPFQLDDGSALLLGTSQWLTPDGRLIRKQGIEPDITIELPVDATVPSVTELRDMELIDFLETGDLHLFRALEELGDLPEGDIPAIEEYEAAQEAAEQAEGVIEETIEPEENTSADEE